MFYYEDFKFQNSSRKSKPIFDFLNRKNGLNTEGGIFSLDSWIICGEN